MLLRNTKHRDDSQQKPPSKNYSQKGINDGSIAKFIITRKSLFANHTNFIQSPIVSLLFQIKKSNVSFFKVVVSINKKFAWNFD